MRRIFVIALGLLAAGLLIALPAMSADDGPYKVRAVFDNGGFMVKGEEVRIAGAKAGLVESVDVSDDEEIVSAENGGTAVPGKAVITFTIDDDGFKDFREDASCTIRPQSLIGERFLDCTPTQPRAPGQPLPPELGEIPEGEEGEGQRLLPLENNGKTVDLDLINNINRAPYRDRFRLILNDLGAGLAARGDDLGAIIDRANPALRQTDRVLKILADQSNRLASLASDGDEVLQPLADNRTSITGFLTNARIAGEATAERSADLEEQLAKFPETLREVTLTMKDLRGFADQGTPLMEDVGAVAPDLSKATQKLAPFARAGTPALKSLGDASELSGPDLVASDPLLVDLRELTKKTAPASKNLQDLLVTFAKTKGFQYLMDFIYYSSSSISGYDSRGHFLRAQTLLSNCLEFEVTPFPGCEAFFRNTPAAAPTTTKKKKKKKGKSSVLRSEQPAPRSETPAPDLLPPIDELIPELAPEPTEPTDPAQPGDDPAEPADEDPNATAVQASSRNGAPGAGPMTMEDASIFLSYLLGAGR